MAGHVLVPLDGSRPSWKALDHAIENYGDTTVTVLHVVDPAAGTYAGVDGGYYDPNGFDRARERGESLCNEARDRIQSADDFESGVVETAIETGNPARTIVEYAADHGVDHVVMGSHGRSGLSRILLGSVAETVVRRAPVPVTVIR